jgi:hypothetical protein
MRLQGIVPTRRSAGLSKSEGNSGLAGTGQEKRVKKMEIYDIFNGGNFVNKVYSISHSLFKENPT